MITHHCPVPPLETATDPIYSTADLGQRWRALMGPFGYYRRMAHFCFVGPDRCFVKVLLDLPLPARPRMSVLSDMFDSVLPEFLADFGAGFTVAALLARPGAGPLTERDRRWAALLTDAADQFGIPMEPLFGANDQAIVAF